MSLLKFFKKASDRILPKNLREVKFKEEIPILKTRTYLRNTGQSSKGVQQNPFCPDALEKPVPGKFALVV